MSYKETITIVNGDILEECAIYTCDVTGEDIDPGDPYYSFNGFHVSTNGVYKLMEHLLIDGHHGGFMPYVMEELLDRYYKRKKFNRYIRPDVRAIVLAKYEHKCVKCDNTEDLTIDHIVPVVEGGKNDFPNLQVLCKSCNSKKGKKPNHVFMQNCTK